MDNHHLRGLSNGTWFSVLYRAVPTYRRSYLVAPHAAPDQQHSNAGLCAHVSRSESNLGPCLIFHLMQRAIIQFCQLAMEGIGRKIVLCINGQTLGVSSPLQSENFEGTIAVFPEIADDQNDALIRDLNDAIAKLQKLQQQCAFSVHFLDNGFNRLPRVSDVSTQPAVVVPQKMYWTTGSIKRSAWRPRASTLSVTRLT